MRSRAVDDGIDPTLDCHQEIPSEVRLLSMRNVGVAVVVIILMGVFSTDNLWPRAGPRYVSKRRGPRRREDPLILDRQLQLQELATMAAENIAGKQPILLFVSLDCILHVVVIAQPIAFDHMQSICIWRAEQVDHRIWPVSPDADGVDHQRVALVMAD